MKNLGLTIAVVLVILGIVFFPKFFLAIGLIAIVVAPFATSGKGDRDYTRD